MAYPNILYKGQYTLKRVLTMPADAAITIADIGKTVIPDATGNIVLSTDGALFYGVLRTINVNDNVCTVDFSGVHEFTAAGAVAAGQAIVPSGILGTHVKIDGVGTLATATTKAVALNTATDTEKVQIFFLN